MRLFHRLSSRVLIVASVLLFSLASAAAQQIADVDNNLPPFGGYSGTQFDLVALQNGNVHITIPILSVEQRRGSFPISFIYDTPSFTRTQVVTIYNGHRIYSYHYALRIGSGWRLASPSNWGLQYSFSTATCSGQSGIPVNTNWTVIDPEGTQHPVMLRTSSSSLCTQTLKNGTTDGSGIMVDISQTPNVLTLKDGSHITLGTQPVLEDPNGNTISGWTDNLNRTLLTITTGPTTSYTTPLGNTASGPSYTLWNIVDANGAQQTYRMDYTGIDVQIGTMAAWAVPAKLTLPSGQLYQFSWVNNSWGQLQQITLPAGASISYSYGSVCSYPNSGPTTTLTCRANANQRTVSVGGTNNIWTYSGCAAEGPTTCIETDPNGNDTVHTFAYITVGSSTSPNTVETQTAYYSGSSGTGTLLRKVVTDYTGTPSPDGTTNLTYLRPIRVTTTLDNNLVSKVETDYDTAAYTTSSGVQSPASYLSPVEKREYDYGSGAPGPLLRRTDYSYLHQTNQTYINLNIIDSVTYTKTYNGSGTLIAQSQNEYDNYTSGIQASGAVQHDSAIATTYTTRGNTTALMQWKNTDGTWLTTRRQYDDAGNILSSTDPVGHTTQFDYTDSWTNIAGTTGGSACAPSGQGKAFPTGVTNALNQITHHTYYSCTGALGSTADPNNLTTWIVYDMLGRTVQVHAPDGGVTTNCFTDAGGIGCQQSGPPLQRVTTKTINASLSETTTAVFDGLGRLTQTQINSDLQGTAYTDTTYL